MTPVPTPPVCPVCGYRHQCVIPNTAPILPAVHVPQGTRQGRWTR